MFGEIEFIIFPPTAFSTVFQVAWWISSLNQYAFDMSVKHLPDYLWWNTIFDLWHHEAAVEYFSFLNYSKTFWGMQPLYKKVGMNPEAEQDEVQRVNFGYE